jgi:hypothetical protein
MMIRFVRMVTSVAAFLFKGNGQQQRSTRPKQPVQFAEHGGRVEHVLERVMTDGDVHRGGIQLRGGGHKLDPVPAELWFEEFGHIVSHALGTVEGGEIPAGADAELEHDIGGTYVGGELRGPESGNPGKGDRGNPAFVQVIATAGFALVVVDAIVHDL